MSRIFVGYSSWFPFMFKIKHCAQHILIVEIMSGFAAWTQLPLLSLSLFVKVIKISLDFSPYFSFTFIISIALVKSKRTALLCHARHYTAQNWGQFFCPSCLQRQFVFISFDIAFCSNTASFHPQTCFQSQAHQGYLLSTMIHSFPLLSAFLLEANITCTPSRISCSHYNLCPLYLCDQVTLAYSTWHHT